jgi:hypothetical protein
MTVAPADRASLERAVGTDHDRYRVEAGLHVKRAYLVTIGRRRTA